MTDANSNGSGAPDANGTGGTGETPPASNAGDDRVSKADHQRALNDLHRFKEQARLAGTEISTLKSQVEELSSKVLSQNKDFETLFNQEKEKRAQAEADRETLKSSVVKNERYKVAYPALKRAGLRDDAENLIDVMDISSIEVEATTNGRFICHGVDAFVELAKAKYPYAFQKPNAPIVNGATGSGTPGTPQSWTPTTLFALEKQCKAKGDMKPYHIAVAEWQKQRQA